MSGVEPSVVPGPCVYLLCDANGRTYIGATVDLRRRLRQHNGELVGGARRTSRPGSCGSWRVSAVVAGFDQWRDALRFEYAWRRTCRRPRGFGVAWRMRGLQALMAKPRWSSTSPLASTVPLVVHTEDDDDADETTKKEQAAQQPQQLVQP